MFATLKNKIKEETGDDVSTSTTQSHLRLTNNNNNYRIRNNRLNYEDSNSSYSECEQLCQLRSQCNELTTKVSTLTEQLRQVEEEKTNVAKTNEILLETVKVAQTQKDIYCEEQEKIQNLQQNEIEKLKNLLSFRDQEAVDRMNTSRQSNQQIENLSLELERLKVLEPLTEDLRDELEHLRHTSQQEKNQFITTLAAIREENSHLKVRVKIAEEARLQTVSSLSSEQQVQALVSEHKLLEQHLEEAHLQLADIKSSWSGQNLALETQVSRLSKQVAEETTEKRKAFKERDDANERIKQLKFALQKANDEMKNRDDKIQILEEEIDELNSALKECREESEQQVLFERNKSQLLETELKDLKGRLESVEERFSEYATNAEQVGQKLRSQVNENQEKLTEFQVLLETERDEKLTALLRNAEISQNEEILRKELRMERIEFKDLQEKNAQLEHDINEARQALQLSSDTTQQNSKLLENVEHMQLELADKNKTIKTLNQRLIDLKKTIQREFRSTQSTTENSNKSSEAYQVVDKNNCIIMDEVNFKYLKHVIVKFLTSREVEARHLIRAVSTLLKLTLEEEKLLNDTLNWKMSWFGSKPEHGSGQHAWSIPPS